MSMAVSICVVRAEDRARLLTDVAWAQAQADQGDSADSVLLGEAWQTMHFALTGTTWKPGAEPVTALERAVLGEGGAPIDAVEAGYGPGRLLDPTAVKEVSAAMEKLPTALVAQRLLTAAGATPSSMHEAELMISDEFELYDDLKDLYADAAEEGAELLFTFG
jgi:Domain of unknown function (DUF1877)